ncbi:kinase-like domain-containing protein [Daldinia decipiens]|uniref:kinase-like domain-containing protein n=1 Tax=Daldinia decipiens TaxID=326647 RepID=UPI0020C3F310|nr:kinase-like domain-containing protein [Daldinia decipiens]KAI1655237.1 kinase-like domain-containing protein [Daldinia decipiens]
MKTALSFVQSETLASGEPVSLLEGEIIGAFSSRDQTDERKDKSPRLEDELQNARTRIPGKDQEFIPIDRLNEIITRQNIQREFRYCLPELSLDKNLSTWVNEIWDEFEYVDLVTGQKMYTSRRKIFAVLILLNDPKKIESFIREDLWDKDLPFIKNAEGKWLCNTEGNQGRVFPWAEGNLKDFWKKHTKPTKTYELALWIADQCRGIAKGLDLIHKDDFEKPPLTPDDARKGRHGDIKPENILWSKDSQDEDRPWMGTLKISDFGLTRWHRDKSNRIVYVNGLAASRTYRAPESDLTQEVFQPWDVWTLACVFLEFLTWYIHGWNEGVDEFSKQRAFESSSFPIREDNFFNLGKKKEGSKYKASLKICWINRLHATKGCSIFIHDFLDLIYNSMLRIRYKERYKCEEVVVKLDDMYRKCRNDKKYCFESAHYYERKRKTNDSDRQDFHDTETAGLANIGGSGEPNGEQQCEIQRKATRLLPHQQTYQLDRKQHGDFDQFPASVTDEVYEQVAESPLELSHNTITFLPTRPIADLRIDGPKEPEELSMTRNDIGAFRNSLSSHDLRHRDRAANVTLTRRDENLHKTSQMDENSLQSSISRYGDYYDCANIEGPAKLSSSVRLNDCRGRNTELDSRAEGEDDEVLRPRQPGSKRKKLAERLRSIIACLLT